MKLDPKANMVEFLHAVEHCEGPVRFNTLAGDSLDLKSTLSQFVFIAVIAGKLQSMNGWIEIVREQDAALLKNFAFREE